MSSEVHTSRLQCETVHIHKSGMSITTLKVGCRSVCHLTIRGYHEYSPNCAVGRRIQVNLVLGRHAQDRPTPDSRKYDDPLSPEGREQAKYVAGRFTTMYPPKPNPNSYSAERSFSKRCSRNIPVKPMIACFSLHMTFLFSDFYPHYSHQAPR